MSGFEVVAGDLRAAAREADAAASGVKAADPSEDVGEVGAALPGSASATAASSLSSTWRTRFQGWGDDAQAQADRLDRSAENYDASDYQADQRLRQLMIRTGEPGY